MKLESHMKYLGTGVKVYWKGAVNVDIRNHKYSFTMPDVVFDGLIGGNIKVFRESSMYFCCFNTRLKATIKFGKPKDNFFEGFIYTNPTIILPCNNWPSSDLFKDKHSIKKPNERIVSQIFGCWFSHFKFDEKTYWDRSHKTYCVHVDEDVLPSDARFREDIVWYIRGNSEQAINWKWKLEEVQRNYQNMRLEFAKKHKKR